VIVYGVRIAKNDTIVPVGEMKSTVKVEDQDIYEDILADAELCYGAAWQDEDEEDDEYVPEEEDEDEEEHMLAATVAATTATSTTNSSSSSDALPQDEEAELIKDLASLHVKDESALYEKLLSKAAAKIDLPPEEDDEEDEDYVPSSEGEDEEESSSEDEGEEKKTDEKPNDVEEEEELENEIALLQEDAKAECPFTSDYRAQNVKELKKNVKDVYGEKYYSWLEQTISRAAEEDAKDAEYYKMRRAKLEAHHNLWNDFNAKFHFSKVANRLRVVTPAEGDDAFIALYLRSPNESESCTATMEEKAEVEKLVDREALSSYLARKHLPTAEPCWMVIDA
jgi:hypothetical protein